MKTKQGPCPCGCKLDYDGSLLRPLIVFLIAFLALELAFCIACGDKVAAALAESHDGLIDFPSALHITDEPPNLEIVDGNTIHSDGLDAPTPSGYLGAPLECTCGFSPAISHTSKDNCIASLKMELGKCKGEIR